MKGIQRFPKTLDLTVLAGVIFAGTLATAITAAAQDVPDLQTSQSPLVLKGQGSFFIGGESVLQTQTEIGGYGFFPGCAFRKPHLLDSQQRRESDHDRN
jgi:hypothetical protein